MVSPNLSHPGSKQNVFSFFYKSSPKNEALFTNFGVILISVFTYFWVKFAVKTEWD